MSKTIILLNGPPRSGKDTVDNWFMENQTGLGLVDHLKFSKVVKERVHAAYGFPDLPYDYFEDSKDEPSEIFLGLTPRQAYIKFSEKYMKPVHGKAVWSEILSKEIENNIANTIVISDLGFQIEFDTLYKNHPNDHLVVLKVYRPGKDFSNDSRGYVDLDARTWWEKLFKFGYMSKKVQTGTVWNRGSLSYLYNDLSFIKHFIMDEKKLRDKKL